jgi:hypothetical protein
VFFEDGDVCLITFPQIASFFDMENVGRGMTHFIHDIFKRDLTFLHEFQHND